MRLSPTTKHLSLLLFLCLYILSACIGNSGPRTPMHGIQLSKRTGISIIRCTTQSDHGSARFELNEIEARGLDPVSLIDLIAPNCRVRVRGQVPTGRYDLSVDKNAFPAQSKMHQRLLIQREVYAELQRIFRIKINHDRARKQVIISN